MSISSVLEVREPAYLELVGFPGFVVDASDSSRRRKLAEIEVDRRIEGSDLR